MPSLGPPAGQLQFIEYIRVCDSNLAERLIISKDAVSHNIHALYTASQNIEYDSIYDKIMQALTYYNILLALLLAFVAVAVVNTCLPS